MPVLKNSKHEAVARAYFADPARVGWRAYAKVYRDSSRRAAETAFSRLLKIAEFSARVAELDGAVAAALVASKVMSATEVLERLTNLGRGSLQSVGHLLVSDDVVGELQRLAPEVAEAIGELVVDSFDERDPDGKDGETRTIKRVRLKLQHKGAALRDLGLHYKLFTERLEVDDKKGLADRLAAARRRAAAASSKKRPG